MMNVKAGDKLILHQHYNGKQVVEVLRVTKTQIVTAHQRFNRETGYTPRSAGSYLRNRVSIPEPGEIERVRDKNESANLSSKMKHTVKWEQLSLEALRDVNAILKQHNQ